MADPNFSIDGVGKEQLSNDLSRIAELLLGIRRLSMVDINSDGSLEAIQAMSEKAGYKCDLWIERLSGCQVCGNYDDWIAVNS